MIKSFQRAALAVAVIALAVFAGFLRQFVSHGEIFGRATIPSMELKHDAGFRYVWQIPPALRAAPWYRAELQIFENSKPLPLRVEDPETVSGLGGGRFGAAPFAVGAAQREFVWLSSSDNSDPLTNGRSYEFELRQTDYRFAARSALALTISILAALVALALEIFKRTRKSGISRVVVLRRAAICLGVVAAFAFAQNWRPTRITGSINIPEARLIHSGNDVAYRLPFWVRQGNAQECLELFENGKPMQRRNGAEPVSENRGDFYCGTDIPVEVFFRAADGSNASLNGRSYVARVPFFPPQGTMRLAVLAAFLSLLLLILTGENRAGMNLRHDFSKIRRIRNSLTGHRLEYIDGLRAVACLLVILCHLDGLAPWRFPFKLAGRELSINSSEWYIGYVGVNLFLVLSGFCLYWPLVRPEKKSEPGLSEFAKRRARRILPPYYIACAFAALIAFISREKTGGFVLKWFGIHIALLQTSVPGYFGKILGQTWSIALEASCYLFFPLFVEAFKKFGPRAVLVLLAILNGIYRWRIIHSIGTQPEVWDAAFTLANNVFGRCFEFAAGMFAANCVSKWITTNRFPMRLCDFVAVALACWQVRTPILNPHNEPARLGALIDISWGVLFGMLVILSSRIFLLQKVLTFPILVWAGEISYSVYLVHAHVLVLLLYIFDFANWPYGLAPFGEIVIALPLCIIVGYVFFCYFEKPFLSPRSPPVLADGANFISENRESAATPLRDAGQSPI